MQFPAICLRYCIIVGVQDESVLSGCILLIVQSNMGIITHLWSYSQEVVRIKLELTLTKQMLVSGRLS